MSNAPLRRGTFFVPLFPLFRLCLNKTMVFIWYCGLLWVIVWQAKHGLFRRFGNEKNPAYLCQHAGLNQRTPFRTYHPIYKSARLHGLYHWEQSDRNELPSRRSTSCQLYKRFQWRSIKSSRILTEIGIHCNL